MRSRFKVYIGIGTLCQAYHLSRSAVESRTGAVAQLAPFPIPAHQTVHADLPHTAFRLISPQCTRRAAVFIGLGRRTPSSLNTAMRPAGYPNHQEKDHRRIFDLYRLVSPGTSHCRRAGKRLRYPSIQGRKKKFRYLPQQSPLYRLF